MERSKKQHGDMWDSLVPRLPTKNPLYSALLLDMPRDALRESHGISPRRVNNPPDRAHSWVWRTSGEYFGSPPLTGMGGTSDGAERRHTPLLCLGVFCMGNIVAPLAANERNGFFYIDYPSRRFTH
jgi:hypothetical protein